MSSNTLSNREMSAIHQYFLNEDTDPSQYEFAKRELGKSTSIIYVVLKGMVPAIPMRYIYFNDGEVTPLNLNSLTRAYRVELENIVPDKTKDMIIKNFVRHDSDEEIEQIESIDDIPNYRNNPLDPDMEISVRKLFQIGESIYVAYFYQRIGGLVLRYRFKFKEDGNLDKVSRTIIGEGIGTPVYYE